MANKNKTGIPSTEEIVEEMFSHLQKKQPRVLSKDFIRSNFSEACESAFNEAHRIYDLHQDEFLDKLGSEIIGKAAKDRFTAEDVKSLVREAVRRGTKAEMTLKQSRASRAGKTFELVMMRLLTKIDIKNEHLTDEDGKLRRIDIVVPDKRTAMNNPFKAHFLSLKTSLKDRWKLVVEDMYEGQRTYLITLLQKETISKNVIDKITEAGIQLYIPDRIKKEQFPNNGKVKKLSDLPGDLE